MTISARIDEADAAVAVSVYAVRARHSLLPIDGVYGPAPCVDLGI